MDTINVTLSDGSLEEMEVVSIFDTSFSSYHYIIYRNHNNEYFIGKYLEDPMKDFYTQISSYEMEFAQGILDGLVGR